MIGFLLLTKQSEDGKPDGPIAVSAEAIILVRPEDDGAIVTLRSGGGDVYVTEKYPDVVRRLTELVQGHR